MSKSVAQTSQDQDYSRVLVSLSSALSSEALDKALTRSVRQLRQSSDHFDWVGIYLLQESDLVLQTYAGDEETDRTCWDTYTTGNMRLCGSGRSDNRDPWCRQGPTISHVLRSNPIRDRCP